MMNTIHAYTNDQRFLDLEARPSGIWGDGPASIYERFDLAAGRHQIAVRLRDSARTTGWDYARTEEVMLEPGRYFTITFTTATREFRFR